MNPLLATAEYDSAPIEKSKNGSKKAAKRKVVNPFIVTPEYEEGTSDKHPTNLTKKRKRDTSNRERPLGVDSEIGRPKKQRQEKSASNKQNGDSKVVDKDRTGSVERQVNQGSSKFANSKFQSRCLNTYSKKQTLVKEHKPPQKNKFNQRLNGVEKTKSKFDPSKQSSVKGSQRGPGPNVPQKRKQNEKPVKDASATHRDAKKKKEHKRRKEEGPITWGLSSSSRGTSESLSLDGIGGFDWNATPQDLARIVSLNTGVTEDEPEEPDAEVVVKAKKLTPAEKRAKALEEEKNMKRKEKELIDAEENPQSPDHFERLLIGSPNSAELWIKYMGYHAVNADIEKARAVAQRAIKRIDPQLVSAKLDMWIAFLNLDFTFSPPDVFKETFSEAIRCNDDYAINTRVLNLYAEAKNVSEVDQLANTMVRKYKDKLENWLQCQNALMLVGLPDKARYMLQKALTVMNKKSHVTLISRFALLENKYGYSEQADALFENLLTSFPQRVDLLNVYVDMLVKSERIDLARSVLERAANNHLPVRKMKAIYTKWIAFEEAHGAPSDVTKVEEAAQKYVSRVMKPHIAPKQNKPDSSDGSGDEAENELSGGGEQLESDESD